MGSGGDILDLIHLALVFGGLLFIEAFVLLWRRKPLLLVGICFVVSMCALGLAYAASRNPLSIVCLSGPFPVQSINPRVIEAGCRAYFFFSTLMTVTYVLGSILIAAGIIILFTGRESGRAN